MKSLDFKKKKQINEKITVLTCYDYPSARIAAESQLDCLLVGDSLAMVVHGFPSTIHATMDMMVAHTEAVSRGLGQQFLISDMPFLSFREGLSQTVINVQRLMQAGAHAIKLEGGDPDVYQTVSHLAQFGIAVIGHLGLTPQSVHYLGGYRVQGRQAEQAAQLISQAIELEKAGCLAVVLECVPAALAKQISEQLTIPTIGIGSGIDTDGQVLVWHDLLGLQTELLPKFVKQYVHLKPELVNALNCYHQDVRTHLFPTLDHGFH
ncbi:MAG: 3-methyl-2-oxobutanoate hydroxymethyltransferase [Gammaproteobacteria bacterium]|nr:3-methyl-2-oxobutanoate hydroxymethyltransferase [Gammaproteobacteria bacterium]